MSANTASDWDAVDRDRPDYTAADLNQIRDSAIPLPLAELNIWRADGEMVMRHLSFTGDTGRDKAMAAPFSGGEGGLLFGGMTSFDNGAFGAQQVKADSPKLGYPEMTEHEWYGALKAVRSAGYLPWKARIFPHSYFATPERRGFAIVGYPRNDWRPWQRVMNDLEGSDKSCGKLFVQWWQNLPKRARELPVIAELIGRRELVKYISIGGKGRQDWATLARIDLTTWQRVSEATGCPIPDDIPDTTDDRSVAFWAWAIEHQLPIVLTEGIKKSLAALAQGIPAISVPGVWMATYKRYPDAPKNLQEHVLSPTLARFVEGGCSIAIAFDADEKAQTRRTVAAATRRVGKAIWQCDKKAAVFVADWQPHLGKGLDDLAADGHALAPILGRAAPYSLWASRWLTDLNTEPTVTISRDELIDGKYIPPSAIVGRKEKIVAIRAPKGSGKTEGIKRHISGKTALALVHRLSIGGMFGDRFGIEAASDIARYGGAGMVSQWITLDSMHAQSQARFDPSRWVNTIAVLDEICQFVWHGLTADTDIRKRRALILQNLQATLRAIYHSPHGQIILSDADLNDTTLDFIARLIAGDDADGTLSAAANEIRRAMCIIDVEPDTAPPRRQAFAYGSAPALFDRAADLARNGQKLLFLTSAQKVGSKWSTRTLEREFKRLFPQLRILILDAETVADRDHPAHRVVRALNGELPEWDIVIASPVIETGCSIDTNHFDAVFGLSHGGQTANSFLQGLARVRTDVPRHYYVPAIATHGYVAGRETTPRGLIASQEKKAKVVRGQFRQFADLGDADYATIDGATECWARMSAAINTQFKHFAATVRWRLESEGYEVFAARDLEADRENEITDAIADARDANCSEDSAEVAAAADIDEKTRDERARATALTRRERTELRKASVADRLAKPGEAVTADDVDRDRDGWTARAKRHFFLTEGREYAIALDSYRTARSHFAAGGIFAHDAIRRNESLMLIALDKIGFTDLVKRIEADPTATLTDEDFAPIASAWTACEAMAKDWGIGSALDRDDEKLGVKLCRSLFRTAGLKLVTTGRSRFKGERRYEYRVASELDCWKKADGGEPDGFDDDGRCELFGRWRDRFDRLVSEWEKERSEWRESVPKKNRTILVREGVGQTPVTPTVSASQPLSQNSDLGGGETAGQPEKPTEKPAPIAPAEPPAIDPIADYARVRETGDNSAIAAFVCDRWWDLEATGQLCMKALREWLESLAPQPASYAASYGASHSAAHRLAEAEALPIC